MNAPLRTYIRECIATEIKNATPRTAAYHLYYHYVFRTKYNAAALDTAHAQVLIDILLAVCDERGYVCFTAAVMPDHVHLILSLKPVVAPSEPMRYIKGRLAHDVHAAFPDIKTGSLWADGYYVEAVGKKNIWQLLSYVTGQEEHHVVEEPPRKRAVGGPGPVTEPSPEGDGLN